MAQTALQHIATRYERSLSQDERRQTGTVYTPAHLVDFILDLVGYTSDEAIERVSLLDPACGCGAFLAGAVHRLARRLRDLGFDLRSAKGGSRLVRAVERKLFGIDRDPKACRLARQIVGETLASHVPSDLVPQDLLVDHVSIGDFLEPPLFAQTPAARYDFVVGNPPYVSTTRLTSADKRALRRRFVSAHGRIDLYALFFERALEVLAPSGKLAFITPDKFLISESARPLRRLLRQKTAVTKVARFRSHRVFAGVATVPCITVLERGAEQGRLDHLECESSGDEPERARVVDRYPVAAPPASGEPWHLLAPRLEEMVAEIRADHPTLDQLSSRISAGVATGRDRVFVLSEEKAGGLEPDLLVPVVRGQDVQPYRLRDSGLRAIIPYRQANGSVPELVDIRNYPRTLRYLEEHRVELEARHCVRTWGKAWFDIHDPWTFDVTAQPKVILPDVASSNRFAFDPGDVLPLHSAYYILPEDVDGEFLATVLNSKVIEFLVRLLAPIVKDGFSRYRRQFLRSLPIPRLAPRAQRQLVNASRSGDREDADRLAADAFSLSSSQYREILSWLCRSRSTANAPGNDDGRRG